MAAEIPVLERKVGVQSSVEVPNYQQAYQNLAESNNLLSTIGATVAQKASNAMASQLGYEAGKNPEADQMPPITEFDKNFAESYNTQAHATLTIQAQQMFDNAHLQISKAPRLTPGLLQSTHDQLQKGIAGLVDKAPLPIKSQLEQSFNSVLLNQMSTYHDKLLEQDRTDAKNNLTNAIDINMRNIMNLGMNGDFKGAQAAADAVKAAASNGSKNNHFTPKEKTDTYEAADQANLNARWTYLALQARKSGREEPFLKEYASDFHGMTPDQHYQAGQAIIRQLGFVKSLENENDDLLTTELKTRIVMDPNSVSQTEWQNYSNSVSNKNKVAETELFWREKQKAAANSTAKSDALAGNWENPEAWANTSPEVQNDTFNRKVRYQMQNVVPPMRAMSEEEAQVKVMSTAGGESQVFTKLLKNKLASANPMQVQSAVMQIQALQATGNGQALRGLNENDKAMVASFNNAMSSADPIKATQELHDRFYNQDADVKAANNQNWSAIVSQKARAGINSQTFALTQFDMKASDFMNPYQAMTAGAAIFNKLTTSFSYTNDLKTAVTSIKSDIDREYGDTYVNGGKFKTLNPIEKLLGFESSDAVPYIHRDMAEQFNKQIAERKALYDKKVKGVDEYWEVVPQTKDDNAPKEDLAGKSVSALMGTATYANLEHEPSGLSSQEHGVFFKRYEPLKIRRYKRTADGTKADTFNVALVANHFGTYDVAIQSRTGIKNLFLEAPYLGIATYIPNKKAIIDNYLKDNKLR